MYSTDSKSALTDDQDFRLAELQQMAMQMQDRVDRAERMIQESRQFLAKMREQIKELTEPNKK